jgi:hypothetical protein
MKKTFIAALIIFLGFRPFCYALETDTHKFLNKYVATNTLDGFSLDSYLKTQLGIQKGVEAKYSSKVVWDWLCEGGLKEDVPYWYMLYLRSVNHFHNPLTNSGFSGIWGSGFLSGESSIQWSQSPIRTQSPGGYYSWNDTRDYFYTALTKTDNVTRDENFSDTFRGLGQLMHLVQDLSVPEHVRDDGHGLSYNYELWAKEKINKDTIANYSPLFYFDKSSVGYANPLAPIPAANLFDTNQYNGTNPAITLQKNIGLSEYTNANFFSGGTIFKTAFPYPASSSVVESNAMDAAGNVKIYLRKIGDGETIDHLAVGRWFYKYVPTSFKNLALKLDDVVFHDYAQKLIPRAVGYSAGLLNYFFRGSLEISVPDSYVYSITDGSKTPYIIQGAPSPHQQFTHIRAKVRNTTPKDVDPNGNPLTYEDMAAGSLQAVARYKIIPNYMPDLSNDPPDGTAMDAVSYSYSVSTPISISSLGSTDPTEYTFDFTTDPIPAGITDLYLNVVFRVTLGGEKDIAVAVGMKDLMEPTHFALWNLTDMFSLDYHLYTWDQIMAAPNLAGRIDLNHNGTCCETGEPYIKPYGVDYQIGFTGDPAANAITVASVNQLPPGRYIRLIALVDADLGENYAQVVWSDPLDNDATKFNIFFEGATYEADEDGWIDTPAETFRLARQHFHSGTVRCIPLAYDQQGVGHCVYNEAEAIPANLEPVGLDIVFP